ncbi:MAG TPA: hypothetical protein VK249_02575 [Anaerolineales bacterium]|nr:hypothetical protein [Anaerolineales bacterium]
MKLLRIGLRVWLMIASVLSFVGGWILLVHAPKPNQGASLYGVTTQTRPTLEPLPPLSNFGGGGDDSQNQFLFNVQPPVRSQSRSFFTTGGS